MTRRLAALALLALAACSTTEIAGEFPSSPLVGPDAARGAPVVASLPATGASGVFRPAGRNGDVTSWRAADGSGFATDRGVLVTTFGLGHDLYAADVSRLVAILTAGRSGTVRRVHRMLDGENNVTAESWDCDVRVSATRDSPSAGGRVRDVTEACEGPGGAFENTYLWSVSGDRAVRSEQFVSREVGMLRIAPPAPVATAIVPVAIGQ